MGRSRDAAGGMYSDSGSESGGDWVGVKDCDVSADEARSLSLAIEDKLSREALGELGNEL